MIAKIKQPGESPERSSSSLVDVVCLYAARLPIQLWYSSPRESGSFLLKPWDILDHALPSGLT
jgi:hypothetical protein